MPILDGKYLKPQEYKERLKDTPLRALVEPNPPKRFVVWRVYCDPLLELSQTMTGPQLIATFSHLGEEMARAMATEIQEKHGLRAWAVREKLQAD